MIKYIECKNLNSGFQEQLKYGISEIRDTKKSYTTSRKRLKLMLNGRRGLWLMFDRKCCKKIYYRQSIQVEY